MHKGALEEDANSLDEGEVARDLLLQAEKIDPRAAHGSAYPLLGWLYHKVPRWPLGFGDDRQADKYFEMGLALNPNGFETSYYYGNFLYEKGDYFKAKTVLQHGLAATLHPPTALAEEGRRAEERDLLEKVKKKLL